MNLLRFARRPLSPLGLAALALAAFALTRSSAFAASYYVDYAGGSDANAGTSTSAAWQHCPGDPVAAATAATTTLNAGDTIYFKGGVTYVLSGTSGIALRWNGAAGAPINYDGNSAGTWGAGHAVFTDNFGGNAITGFSATASAAYLTFTSLEFSAIGGAVALPIDNGSAVAARFGGGLAFNGGATNVTIDRCSFHDLGYWFNQKPMNASSIAGTAIAIKSANTVTISNSDFYHVAVGIELFQATSLSNLTITNCSFHDSVCWTIDLPPPPIAPSNATITGNTETNNSQFSPTSWTGYGVSPRTDVQTVLTGSNVTLKVAAAATPAAMFQWLKNGVAISGATSSTFALSSVTAADSATYTVVATNSAGTTSSNSAVLTVYDPSAIPPAITSEPVNAVAAPLATATFSVSATGTPAPSYQWLKNGVAIAGSGWTQPTLTIAGVTTNDAASYACIVTNSAGSATSDTVTLTVSTNAIPPVIATQPASQTVTAGSNVSFSVAANGSPMPTYQWLKNGTPIAGATNATLTLTSVSVTDAASYAAIASNSAGTATSNAATLTVNSAVPTTTAPAITMQPSSQSANAGTSVTFTVAASGTPAPTYQWFKNGAAIGGATSASLTLPAVGTADQATYKATASNTVGSATSADATLTINVAPAITADPQSQTAALKSTVTFSVAATGTPAPSYQWYKDGTAITGATATSFTIRNASKSSAGTYKAIATNVAGAASSNGATLTISSGKTSPLVVTSATADTANTLSIVTSPAKEAMTAGSTATFSVTATSTSALYYQWTKNDQPILGANSPTFSIANVQAADAGAYAVVVNDRYNSVATDPASLVVAPTGTADSRVANLSVRATAGGGDATLIVGFVVQGTASKALLVRGIGPGLSDFGVTNALPDPVLSLYAGSSVIDANRNWASSAASNQIATTSSRVGAFALASSHPDTALLPTVAPGAYTAQVVGASGDTGNALVELYDAAPNTASHLVNVSARIAVDPAVDAPTIGFVVSGSTSKALLIRAAGPALAALGVQGTLADPQIEIFQGTTRVQQNDNWGGDPTLNDAFSRVGAFSFGDGQSKDAALIFNAAPGAYTAVVSGVNQGSGIVLVEVYELP